MIAGVENINPDDIEYLGSCLDVDPSFFAGHIASSYGDIENTPAPPLLALPPSRLISREFINIHYQKLLDLGAETTVDFGPCHLALVANVTRRVRRLPVLSGRSIGLLQACTSVIKKRLFGKIWISLILVDPASNIVSYPDRGTVQTNGYEITQNPRRIGVEIFIDLPKFSEYQAANATSWDVRSSDLSGNLLSLFQVSPPTWEAGNPSILSLAYYPIQAVLQEWMLYGLLMGRYTKYYEYSFKTVSSRLDHFEKQDIIELHRWRRRSLQSLQKLRILRLFLELYVSQEDTASIKEVNSNTPTMRFKSLSWDLHQTDIKYCEDQILQHSRSLEALNPIITALVQLLDSHKSISQARDIRRLTYIAMAFIPLTFVTGLFSMSEPYGPGKDRFWIYWAVAVPTAALVMGILAVGGGISAFLVLCRDGRKRAVGQSNWFFDSCR